MRPLRVLAAALLALSLAGAPAPARAASVLSDGSVTPTSGTTATAFTFSVHYTSTDSPTRPAQAVWAQVGEVTVALIKVSGSANDGTWQGTATLPAGTWQVTFHAATTSDPQPEPIAGPIVTVTEPPVATPEPTPQPTEPAPPPPEPVPPTNPTPRPVPQPTPPPTDVDDPTQTQSPSPSPTPSASGSTRPRTPAPTASRTSADEPSASAPASDDDAANPPGSTLVSLLIVGGSMSLIGAAVLARQWYISRRVSPGGGPRR